MKFMKFIVWFLTRLTLRISIVLKMSKFTTMINRLFGSFRDSSKLEKVQQTEFPIVIFCFLWIIVVVFWESIDNTEEKFKQKAMIMGTLTIIELVIFFVLQIVVHMVTGMTGFSGIWSAMTGYICAHTLYKIITIIQQKPPSKNRYKHALICVALLMMVGFVIGVHVGDIFTDNQKAAHFKAGLIGFIIHVVFIIQATHIYHL